MPTDAMEAPDPKNPGPPRALCWQGAGL